MLIEWSRENLEVEEAGFLRRRVAPLRQAGCGLALAGPCSGVPRFEARARRRAGLAGAGHTNTFFASFHLAATL